MPVGGRSSRRLLSLTMQQVGGMMHADAMAWGVRCINMSPKRVLIGNSSVAALRLPPALGYDLPVIRDVLHRHRTLAPGPQHF